MSKQQKQSIVIPTETLERCKAKIDSKANISSKFKIGKTGDTFKGQLSATRTVTLDERFGTDYKKEFGDGIVLSSSVNRELIDALEVELIQYAKQQYPDKCKNKSETTRHKMTDKIGSYRVYITFKATKKTK